MDPNQLSLNMSICVIDPNVKILSSNCGWDYLRVTREYPLEIGIDPIHGSLFIKPLELSNPFQLSSPSTAHLLPTIVIMFRTKVMVELSTTNTEFVSLVDDMNHISYTNDMLCNLN